MVNQLAEITHQHQKEDLNSGLYDVTAPVLDSNAVWPALVVMERSGPWPCVENGNMSHRPSPRMAGSKRCSAMGQNVPPDAEDTLPAALSPSW